MMPDKRICDETCKGFHRKKPTGVGRYESGQCLCMTCNTWMDHEGCHLADGSPATVGDSGWYCNCCNYRVRRKPRNIEYKAKLKASGKSTDDKDDLGDELKNEVDLSYFSKRRAKMMRKIADCMVNDTEDMELDIIEEDLIDYFSLPKADIEHEFGCPVETLVKLAYEVDPPNKMSMILEFERVRTSLGGVPTEQEFEERSGIELSWYIKEFQSWGHMLEGLGYDPFYRDRMDGQQVTANHVTSKAEHVKQDKNDMGDLDKKTYIKNKLRNDQDMLDLFNALDANVGFVDRDMLEDAISRAEYGVKKFTHQRG